MASLARLGLRVLRGNRVLLADPLVPLALKGLKAIWGRQDLKVSKVSKVFRASKAPLAPRAYRAFRASKV